MDEFFQVIRAQVTPAVWSKGVELARGDNVTGDSVDSGEITLRVANPKGGVSPVVTLVPDNEDWHCSCNGPDDPCAHVVAAVIALRRALEQGQELPKSQSAGGHLIYSLRRTAAGLSFERAVQLEDSVEPLTVALSALTSGRVKGPPLSATAADMQVEVALASDRRGVLPAVVWPRLLQALQPPITATLDGQPVAIDPQPVGLQARVVDEGAGVRLRLQQDEAIVELFQNGVALCKTGLRPVVLPQLSPDERPLLREGRYFGPRDFTELVAEILPRLQGRIPVDQKARQLPRGTTTARPQIALQLKRVGEGLQAKATLVYGDPPLARLEAGRLLLLGDQAPLRDFPAEARLRADLTRSLGLELDETALRTGGQAVAFVQALKDFRGPVSGDDLAAFRLYPQLTPSLRVTAGGHRPEFTGAAIDAGDLDLQFSFATALGAEAGKGADPQRVLAAWQAGESLVPLLDGGFAPIPAAWLAAHGERILDFLAARGEAATKVPRAILPLLAEVASHCGETLPPALAEFCARLRDPAAELPHLTAPTILRATLRPYQQAGVTWLTQLRALGVGALLADDMGLGKTLQALAIIAPGKSQAAANSSAATSQIHSRTLVIAPTSVLPNWLSEAAKFRPDLTTCRYHGSGRTLDQRADLVVTSYTLLRLDMERLASQPWDLLIFDEAQMLKNPSSQAARAASGLQAASKIALSGTPVENRLEDLWSLMHILNPGLLGDLRHFRERYARPITSGDDSRAALLRTRVRPFILRRLKTAVAPELPPRTETVLYAELSPAERERYDIVRAASRREVLEKLEKGGNVLAALEALLRLRQAACHPDLLPGVSGTASAKLELLTETLVTAHQNGHKTLVFSQWTQLLDLIEPALQTAGLPYLRLDGATTDRAGIVTAFQAEDGPPVLIMSLKAGGVGLNLTAADHVIIMDPWWNPAAEDQAADRAHRIGQTRPVLVQRLVSIDTVEERILALQERKRGLAQSALADGGTQPMQGALSREDLLALLD